VIVSLQESHGHVRLLIVRAPDGEMPKEWRLIKGGGRGIRGLYFEDGFLATYVPERHLRVVQDMIDMRYVLLHLNWYYD